LTQYKTIEHNKQCELS